MKSLPTTRSHLATRSALCIENSSVVITSRQMTILLLVHHQTNIHENHPRANEYDSSSFFEAVQCVGKNNRGGGGGGGQILIYISVIQ